MSTSSDAVQMPAPPTPRGVSRRKLAAAAFGASGVFLATFDPTALAVALPTIAGDLQIDLQSVQWVGLVTMIVTGALLLGTGRLADLAGRKKVFLVGVGVFALGALVSAVSPNLFVLIAGRAVMGVGAAALNSMGPALVVWAPSRTKCVVALWGS